MTRSLDRWHHLKFQIAEIWQEPDTAEERARPDRPAKTHPTSRQVAGSIDEFFLHPSQRRTIAEQDRLHGSCGGQSLLASTAAK